MIYEDKILKPFVSEEEPEVPEEEAPTEGEGEGEGSEE